MRSPPSLFPHEMFGGFNYTQEHKKDAIVIGENKHLEYRYFALFSKKYTNKHIKTCLFEIKTVYLHKKNSIYMEYTELLERQISHDVSRHTTTNRRWRSCPKHYIYIC